MDQNKPSTSPDRLLRAFCVVPLEGQEETAIWSLGFKEVGTTLRSASLSRDFSGVASLVDAEQPCYLVVYVGDVQDPSKPTATSGVEPSREWVLISYVPSSCSSFEAKKMADNRAGLKAGLGAERFMEGGMWCVHVEQISLSNYMRSTSEAAAASGDAPLDAPALPAAATMPAMPDLSAGLLPDAGADLAAASKSLSGLGGLGGAGGAMSVLLPGTAAALATGQELVDETEAIWEERIKGVRGAYVDSCSRLVGALEELEETLCALTGEPYRPDEPILRARVHMSKNLEALSMAR